MALLKTEVPRLAGQGTNQKIEGLRRYLEELQRSLDFVLQNLGEENFNGRALRLPVLTADGARSLGTLGETEGGVGLACGDKGLRVTEAGAEISDDGTVWETLATARALRELTAADVGARPDTWMPTAAEVGAVPTSRTVNGKALSSNITLSASDVGAVPTSRTVNGKALSGNITLSAADVGAVAKTGDTMAGNLVINGSTDVGASLEAAMPTRGTVEDGTNLNTLQTNGVYFLSGARTYTNMPNGVGYGVMTVNVASSGGFVYQALHVGGTYRARVFGRIYVNSEWTMWVEFTAQRGQMTDGTNLNSVLVSGVYQLSGSHTYSNLPSGVQWGVLTVSNTGSSFAAQEIVTSGGATHKRVYTGSAWSAWKTL